MTRAVLLSLLCLFGVVLAGCPKEGVYEETLTDEPKPTATIVIEADVPDGLVYVNDVFQGRVRDLRNGVRVIHGDVRVEVRHQRHHTHYQLVTVKKGKTALVRARMREILE